MEQFRAACSACRARPSRDKSRRSNQPGAGIAPGDVRRVRTKVIEGLLLQLAALIEFLPPAREIREAGNQFPLRGKRRKCPRPRALLQPFAVGPRLVFASELGPGALCVNSGCAGIIIATEESVYLLCARADLSSAARIALQIAAQVCTRFPLMCLSSFPGPSLAGAPLFLRPGRIAAEFSVCISHSPEK